MIIRLVVVCVTVGIVEVKMWRFLCLRYSDSGGHEKDIDVFVHFVGAVSLFVRLLELREHVIRARELSTSPGSELPVSRVFTGTYDAWA